MTHLSSLHSRWLPDLAEALSTCRYLPSITRVWLRSRHSDRADGCDHLRYEQINTEFLALNSSSLSTSVHIFYCSTNLKIPMLIPSPFKDAISKSPTSASCHRLTLFQPQIDVTVNKPSVSTEPSWPTSTLRHTLQLSAQVLRAQSNLRTPVCSMLVDMQ